MPALTTDEPYFILAPDWVCEVLSPATEAMDRVRKSPIYARESVSHVWLVDPLQRMLEELRRQNAEWLIIGVYEGNALVRAEPFDALQLDLGILRADVILK